MTGSTSVLIYSATATGTTEWWDCKKLAILISCNLFFIFFIKAYEPIMQWSLNPQAKHQRKNNFTGTSIV